MNRLSMVALFVFIASCNLAFGADKKKGVDAPAVAQIGPNVPVIEIKGVKLGMPRDAVEDIIGNLYTYKEKYFTIGDVGTESGKPPLAEYIDEKLSSLYFAFSSKNFESVRDAVWAKYPTMKCAVSRINNRMGASFEQVDCRLTSSNGVLTMQRFSGTLDSGDLFLISNDEVEKQRLERLKKKSDI